MADYGQEIDALQRFVWGAAGLKSMRMTAAPPEVARPTILWEAPGRQRAAHIGRYAYRNQVTQFGRLFVQNLDELLRLQYQLQQSLEALDGVIPVYDKGGPAGVVVAHLRMPSIEFGNAEGLDVPVTIRYTRTMTRTNKPAAAPPPTFVGTRQDVRL